MGNDAYVGITEGTQIDRKSDEAVAGAVHRSLQNEEVRRTQPPDSLLQWRRKRSCRHRTGSLPTLNAEQQDVRSR